MTDKFLIVGLGNPGSAYRGTLHNAGREIVEDLAARHRVNLQKVGECLIGKYKQHIFAIPETFMNLSGKAVGPIASVQKIPAAHVLVIVDDVYLPMGTVRLRASGSDGGHNGLKSIEEYLGTREYPRLRIGVGPDPGGARRADYVLSRPSPQMEPNFFEGKARGLAIVDSVLHRGIDHAMKVSRA